MPSLTLRGDSRCNYTSMVLLHEFGHFVGFFSMMQVHKFTP